MGAVCALHILLLWLLSSVGTFQLPFRTIHPTALTTITVSLPQQVADSARTVVATHQQAPDTIGRPRPAPRSEKMVPPSAPSNAPIQTSPSNPSSTPSSHNGLETPATNPSPELGLNLDTTTLLNATREVDRKSVRRLARDSGQLDIFDAARPDPLKLALAQTSEPPCPNAGLMREARGDRMGAPMPDRSGDCERQRSERIRVRAMGR